MDAVSQKCWFDYTDLSLEFTQVGALTCSFISGQLRVNKCAVELWTDESHFGSLRRLRVTRMS